MFDDYEDEPEAKRIFDMADQLDDRLDDYALERCKSSEHVIRGGNHGRVYTFHDGSKLTTAETGYVGCEY
jgi:hypothetical protein